MYMDERFQYQTIERCSNEAFQALFTELHLPKSTNIICGVLYRQHNSPERFQEYFDSTKCQSVKVSQIVNTWIKFICFRFKELDVFQKYIWICSR